jgi:hypothetical protein
MPASTSAPVMSRRGAPSTRARIMIVNSPEPSATPIPIMTAST